MVKVGFDFDGVLLYNPVRIFRPFVAVIKRLFIKKRALVFYYPHSAFEKFFWRLFHKSSIFVSPGVEDIKQLIKQKKIKAYIITARYNFLGEEFKQWIKKNKFEDIFSEIYFNSKDEQPHLFKERMIKKLGLQVFVEDNFDIVKYLRYKNTAIVMWIYNIFDRGIYHRYKYPDLKRAVNAILHETKTP